jgi:hypothetical protein
LSPSYKLSVFVFGKNHLIRDRAANTGWMCNEDSLEPPKNASHIFFWGFDLRGHSRVKNKKESIDGLGEALVSVPYITPRSFL